MEVIIDLFNLSDVFILHLSSGSAFLAWLLGVTEDNLIDDYVVDVDVELSELDC
jgi:hypothetical protein